jgi:phosphoserine phosphatase
MGATGAHVAVTALQRAGIEVVIASITWHFAVAWFARSLNVRRFVRTKLSRSGGVAHVWPTEKGYGYEPRFRNWELHGLM